MSHTVSDRFDPDERDAVSFARAAGWGVVVGAATQILSDGKPRSADQIHAEAAKKSLIKPTTSRYALYNDLKDYMMRMKATGRDPVVVQDPLTHEFRLNRPVDDWPAVALAPRPRYTQSKAIEKIADRLRESGSGDDPATFEQTVCDAFAMMGFVARHIGGQAAPDGTLDAPLGPLGFRAILECKGAPSGRHVSNPRPEEPARFRDADGADFAVLVGAVFKDEVSLQDELTAHRVSLWTIDDIVTALRNDVDVFECRDLFAPGYVRDRLTELEWKRNHGAEKRVLVVRDILRREGYATQCSLVGNIARADAPVLTLDAAIILVEAALQHLKTAGMATRAEVQTAMDDLVRAEEAVAVPERNGIVIRRGVSSA